MRSLCYAQKRARSVAELERIMRISHGGRGCQKAALHGAIRRIEAAYFSGVDGIRRRL